MSRPRATTQTDIFGVEEALANMVVSGSDGDPDLDYDVNDPAGVDFGSGTDEVGANAMDGGLDYRDRDDDDACLGSCGVQSRDNVGELSDDSAPSGIYLSEMP